MAGSDPFPEQRTFQSNRILGLFRFSLGSPWKSARKSLEYWMLLYVPKTLNSEFGMLWACQTEFQNNQTEKQINITMPFNRLLTSITFTALAAWPPWTVSLLQIRTPDATLPVMHSHKVVHRSKIKINTRNLSPKNILDTDSHREVCGQCPHSTSRTCSMKMLTFQSRVRVHSRDKVTSDITMVTEWKTPDKSQ